MQLLSGMASYYHIREMALDDNWHRRDQERNVFLNWFQCQGQFFDSNRYKITTVTGEKSVSTAWPPY